MFKSEIIFKHRFRWLVQLWLKRRNEKKEKCFSRHELPLNEKEQKNYAFFRVFSLLQPTSFHDTLLVGPFICTPLHHWCFYTPGTISYAYRGTATSISKLLARTINPPPSPSPFREEYTPPKMATTRVALKKDLHVWSLLPSSFRSWDSSRFEIKQKSGMNERLDEDFRIDISYLEKFSRGNWYDE